MLKPTVNVNGIEIELDGDFWYNTDDDMVGCQCEVCNSVDAISKSSIDPIPVWQDDIEDWKVAKFEVWTGCPNCGGMIYLGLNVVVDPDVNL